MNPKYHDSLTNFRDNLQSIFGPTNAQVFKPQIVDLKSCISCANASENSLDTWHWFILWILAKKSKAYGEKDETNIKSKHCD